MKKLYTSAELKRFDKITSQLSSHSQMDRIIARIRLVPDFIKKHGRKKCDAMYDVLQARDSGIVIERPYPGIIHLKFKTQSELTRAMIRMAEFYESPYPKIRGHYFTLDQFKAAYTKTHGEPFSYFKDWHGFNIPGIMLREFKLHFAHDLTPAERVILGIKGARYLIATHREWDVTHEIAHGIFYLNSTYRHSALEFVKSASPFLLRPFKNWLKREGYTKEVFDDEINAYFATNDRREFRRHFSPQMADALYDAASPFRRLLTAYMPK